MIPVPQRAARTLSLVSLLLTAFLRTAGLNAQAEIAFHAGDTVLFYGNSMVERLGEQGELEALVQLAHPDKKLHFRSLAWTGDEVGYRLRPEGYEEHLKSLLKQWPAKVVVVGFGMNEAFAGAAGLADFRAQLSAYLDQLGRLHPDAKFVLLSPTLVESGVPGQDAAARNRDITAYAFAIGEAARARGALFIDLAAASLEAKDKSPGPLTENGLHLNEAGNRAMARVIARALIGPEALARVDSARVAEVAKAVTRKAYYVAEVVRPKNADLYYGVRKRPEENAAEIPRYYQMIAATEAVIHQLAAAATPSPGDHPMPWLPPLPPIAGHDDGNATGVIQSPAEMQAGFTVAPGYAVNLFASELEFPELKNPVQIAFDARGRLWVVTMPSFPHTVPGLPPEDKLLVLEDTDHDGRADRCTTFAEGLDALDGVAFSPAGVIVSEQPKLWLMADSDGDGRADRKREWLRGIDVTDSHHGGMIATDPIGDVLFCDGVFHRSQIETPYGVVRGIDSTTYRFNPRTGRVETEWQSITPNPWKITYDRTGNLFQMYGDGLVLDALPLTWTPLAVYHPFAYAQTIGYGKGSAAASVSSPNFPDDYQQGMASAALLGSYVVSLTRYDFSQGMVRGSGRLDLVSSTNAAFRPADLAFGFDGALYVSDFCSVIIGHAQHPMRDPHWDHTHGRIWRVVNTEKPVVKEFPRIEGASTAELLALLRHPQDIVRHHVRIELLKSGSAMQPALDAWAAALDRSAADFDQSALEVLFVSEARGQTQPQLLEELLKSRSPLHRAAAVNLIRLQADRLPNTAALLSRMAADPHPRVQMEVVDAVAHLRPRYPAVEHAVHDLHPASADVQRMLEDLQYGTAPAKGRSVPVLEFAPETRLTQWLWTGTNASAAAIPYDASAKDSPKPGSGLYRTYLRSDAAQPAVLAVRHGYLDISVNGVQLLSFDSMWSNEQQLQLPLKAGLNVIEIEFRKLRGAAPAVYCFDPLGQPLTGVRLATEASTLSALASEADRAQTGRGDTLRVQAVPGRMQFAPRELRVKAGASVRLVFENPDLMLHNLLILAPGSAEEIGALADLMAVQPDALRRGYIPDSAKVLHATPLVQPKRSAELQFTAPSEPGSYPFLCTFPGHWRMMRGALVVE
jgi:plastocyanin/glucose/arabinose dehydrogenase/lysophospholipase L1-like esterase